MVLIDTSIWIEIFRANKPLRIERVIDFDEIATCLPIIQEILQGFRDERAFRVAHESMLSLPIVESPLTADVFEEAISLYRTAIHQGLKVRSSIDCLIAACALRHDLEILHRDRDFTILSQISPLRQREI